MNPPNVLRALPVLAALLVLSSCAEKLPSEPVTATAPAPANSEPVSESVLRASLARWSSAGIESYRYRFEWQCFCDPDYRRQVDVRVSRGVVTSVTDARTGEKLSAEEASRYRTIEGMFEFFQSAIAGSAASVNGSFDARLGYPASGDVDFDAGVADEEMGFRIESLTATPR